MQFYQDIEVFKAAIEGAQASDNRDSKTKITSKLQLEVIAYSDILLNDRISIANLQERYNFLDLMSLQIKNINNSMRYPIVYIILPVLILPLFLPIQISKAISASSVSTDYLKKFIQLFDSFCALR